VNGRESRGVLPRKARDFHLFCIPQNGVSTVRVASIVSHIKAIIFPQRESPFFLPLLLHFRFLVSTQNSQAFSCQIRWISRERSAEGKSYIALLLPRYGRAVVDLIKIGLLTDSIEHPNCSKDNRRWQRCFRDLQEQTRAATGG
jgi:hypothetical protein